MACGRARAARVGAPAPAKPPSRRRGRPLRRHAGVLAAGGAGRAATLAAVSRRGGAGGAARLVGGARCVSAAGVEAPEQQRPERSSEAPQLQEGATWQIDFCSRPMLDERGKKVWELLVCDDTGALRHAEYFANNKVNSSNLKVALEALFASLGGVRPAKVRFFRTQMNTIIGRALKDLNIKPVPSLKCAELIAWLDDRYDTVYTQHPGFQPDVAPLMGQEAGPVEELPEELRGSQWAFVELELGELIEEARSVREGGLFGDALDVAAFAEEMGLPLNTPVPGVVALSQRAAAVAAWTSGIEVVALQADDTRASLVMEANVSTRFRYATWPRNDAAADDEAREWTQAKAKAGGLHFLALQADADEDVVGFWALRDIKLPRA